MSRRQRLTRTASPALAGVCGGIAEFLGWEPRSVRWLWAGVTLLSGFAPGVIAYTVLAIVMPGPDAGSSFQLDDYRTQQPGAYTRSRNASSRSLQAWGSSSIG